MTRAAWAFGLVLAAQAWLATAAAHGQTIRQGLPLAALEAALASHGLVGAGITVPDDPELPVRVTFADVTTGATAALLDVRAFPAHGEALDFARERARTVSARGTHPHGAGAWIVQAPGPRPLASLLVLARDNLVVVARALEQRTFEVDRLIADLERSIAAAPAGIPRPRPSRTIEVPQQIAVGASYSVQVPAEWLAARVRAAGAGYARRTPRGWSIVRTGPGPIEARLDGVDALLR